MANGSDKLLLFLGILAAIFGGALLVYAVYDAVRRRYTCPICDCELQEGVRICSNCHTRIEWRRNS